jgi:metal-responsive CopG/Arc/MetJ family transcriptional regulator
MISMRTIVSHSIDTKVLKRVEAYAKVKCDNNRSRAIEKLLIKGLEHEQPAVDVSCTR